MATKMQDLILDRIDREINQSYCDLVTHYHASNVVMVGAVRRGQLTPTRLLEISFQDTYVTFKDRGKMICSYWYNDPNASCRTVEDFCATVIDVLKAEIQKIPRT